MTGYGLTITATQLTIAGSIEMQAVGTIRAVVGRDDLRGMDSIGQFVNLLLAADADTFTTSLHDITNIEVHLLGFQLQVATEVLVHLLHHASPLGIAGIGLALMHQDTLDDTILLGFLGQSDQTLIGVIVVSSQHTLHPLWSLVLGIVFNTVGQEAFDPCSWHSSQYCRAGSL